MEGDKALDVIDDTILHILSLYDHLTPLQVWYELGEDGVVGEKLTEAEVLDRLEALKVKGFLETVTKAQVGGRSDYRSYRLADPTTSGWTE